MGVIKADGDGSEAGAVDIFRVPDDIHGNEFVVSLGEDSCAGRSSVAPRGLGFHGAGHWTPDDRFLRRRTAGVSGWLPLLNGRATGQEKDASEA